MYYQRTMTEVFLGEKGPVMSIVVHVNACPLHYMYPQLPLVFYGSKTNAISLIIATLHIANKTKVI